jgi:hypothetical protein
VGLVKSGAGAELRFSARRLYRTVVRSKKRQYRLKQAEQICGLAISDPKSFWKRLRGTRKPLRLRDKTIWHTHFSELLSVNEDPPSDAFQTPSTSGIEVTNRLFNPNGAASLNVLFSRAEVDQAITRMKNNKAAGIDGMKPEFLKISKEALVPPLTVIINRLFVGGVYPTQWSQGVIVPCYKSGDKMKTANYRGITLVPMLDKLFASMIMLCTRISKWTEEKNLRARCQAGFRKDHGTTDQLFIHRTIIETSIYEKKTLFCAYID